VPSAGKTTLSKTLQERLPDQYFLIPVDILNEISPPKNSRSYDRRFTSDPKPVLTSIFGSIKTFADNGLNVITDVVFNKESPLRLDVYLDVFPDCDYPSLFVHVTCPLEELRRREKVRGDRKIGLGESLLPKLEPQSTYDITVDTYLNTKEECADRIIELTEDMNRHTSFKTLWLQRHKLL
jgi:chloramphenicol 3-O phosphotransferase